MNLQLLGPIEAHVGDRRVALGAPKQRAVLAMLALEANRTVSTDDLAEGLWGQWPPASAPKMVQLYVSQLRRALDGNEAAIVTRGRGYELRLAPDAVDAVRFERLVDEGRPREALALWRGAPLADVADEPFAAAEARRLEELRLRAQELAIDADLEAGRHGDVIAELDALVVEHPLREHLHAQRILALYRSGRQAEALGSYQQARRTLVEEIGVEPGEELRSLHRAVLAQDPALTRANAEAIPAPADTELRPSPRRRTIAVLVAAGLAALAGLLAFGISRITEPDSLPAIDENAVGVIDAGDGRITAQYAVGRSPASVVAGADSIWVANTLDGTVSRIDRAREQVVTIPVGGSPTALAFGEGSLWVTDGDARTVAQLDPRTNKVVRSVEVGNGPRGVAAAYGYLWAASAVDGAVERVSLRGDGSARSIPMDSNASAIAAGGGSVWVASEDTGTVTQIHPRSGKVLRVTNVGNGPSAVAVGAGAVWVANRQDATVSRIDPTTGAVTATVALGGDPVALATGADAVWVAGGMSGTVTRIDAETARVAERLDVGSAPAGVAVDSSSVWVSAGAPPARHRGGTLRVGLGQTSTNWLLVDAYGPSSWQLLSLAYDGLVAYRRSGGAPGGTLVGALATSAPEPSRDGRTYVFTLRPGLRYSDGRAVMPADFRASMERLLRATGTQFPAFYAGIRGAQRCMRNRARCDLSAGIQTDEQARTITIRLTRADGEFLHKLAHPFAFVVPAGTPLTRDASFTPPGTGPYRFAEWDANRGGTLVRNSHFRSWSPDARPSGYVDRIEVSARAQSEIGAVTDVLEGDADFAVLADPFSSVVGPRRLQAVIARAPAQVYGYPAVSVLYMFLNTRVEPFDDPRVRRALNYATDRGHVVDLQGGPDVAHPTCQIVPVGLLGYRPYCPYTSARGQGRGWTGPQMARAHRLIARSGTAGQRVVVRVPDFERPLGRYFTELLSELGYRAKLNVLPADNYFGTVYDPRTKAQTGFMGWAADYASASNVIEPNFGCASLASPPIENPSYLCDPALERDVRMAVAARGSDAVERWAAIDRRVTDLAPAVPLVNPRSLVVVSKRVGNVQNHVQWSTLLDQLWVR